jgi:hypothetical protein
MKFLGFSFATLSLIAVLLSAQNAASNPATITFTLDFPASVPSHYSISIHQNGHGAYQSSARPSPDSDDESYESEFIVSPANRDRIFALAKQANYFTGKIDSGNRKLAFTGIKTLAFDDGAHKASADFNYSPIAAVQQLTAFFQSLASTLDYGRKLSYSHHYQKLALDEELKQIEAQARNDELGEIGAIAPVLQEIYDDTSVINVVRARAQRLIEMGKIAAEKAR